MQSKPASELLLSVRRLPDHRLDQLWKVAIVRDNLKSRLLHYLDRVIALQAHRISNERLALRRSILLKGAPGTGKTTLGMAAPQQWARSREREAVLVHANLHALASAERGGSERNVGKLGVALREAAAAGLPTFVLLDEIETATADRRSINPVTNPADTWFATNAFIQQLDTLVSETDNLIQIQTSNFPSMIDPAVLDRFDFVIDVPLPDQHYRRLILEDTLGELTRTGLAHVPPPDGDQWATFLTVSEGLSARQLRHLGVAALTFTASAMTFDHILAAAQDAKDLALEGKGERI